MQRSLFCALLLAAPGCGLLGGSQAVLCPSVPVTSSPACAAAVAPPALINVSPPPPVTVQLPAPQVNFLPAAAAPVAAVAQPQAVYYAQPAAHDELGLNWIHLPIPYPALHPVVRTQLVNQVAYQQVQPMMAPACAQPQTIMQPQTVAPPLAQPAAVAPVNPNQDLCNRLDVLKSMIEQQQKTLGCGGK